MSDTSYNIEVKPASKNGYFTPLEANNYYGRYDRSGYCVHWWGGGETADKHDSIVNYLLNQAQLGNKSTNYVASDGKITLMVGPDNVAWAQESGNATEISVETQPTLSAEGYKKHGWLKNQLDERYNRKLAIHGHNFWYATQCPGTISLDRILQEADKWARGEYEAIVVPPVVVPPAPEPVKPVLTPITTVTKYTLADAKLVNVKDLSVVKTFPIDTPIEIGATITYNNLTFFVSVYARDHNTGQAFLQGDLKDAKETTPVPSTPDPDEWVKNLRDIDDTEYWFLKDQDLISIPTEKPTGTKTFSKDESFVASAITVANGVEYRITDYSYKKNIFNGVPTDSLTLTKPGVPDIPPVVEPTQPDTGKDTGDDKMNSVNINVLLIRALKTFIQATAAACLAGLSAAVSIPTTKALIIGAISAGVSAVMNLFLAPQEPK